MPALPILAFALSCQVLVPAKTAASSYLEVAPPKPLRFLAPDPVREPGAVPPLAEFEKNILRRDEETEAGEPAEATRPVAPPRSEAPRQSTDTAEITSSLQGLQPFAPGILPNPAFPPPVDAMESDKFLYYYRRDLNPETGEAIEIPILFDPIPPPPSGQIPSSATLIKE